VARRVCDLENLRDEEAIARVGLQRYIKKNMSEQDRHCTYYVTSRRIGATIFAVEKQPVLHFLRVCVCSLRHPACSA
jgi:hypothetical protein